MTTARGPEREALGPVEIRAEAIVKHFGDVVVLDGIDLVIRRGEIVAFVGASGCGKTVLLHILTGLLEPDSGRVLVANHHEDGAPLVELTSLDQDAQDEVRLSWAVVFQRNALFSVDVRENCSWWLREHTQLSRREIAQRVRASLEAVSLDADAVLDKDRDELSGGMAKRVAVARAIAQDPQVVFYDEPTTGLDPMNSAHIHDLIWKTHYRRGAEHLRRTSIVITHDSDLLRRVHPRIILLHEGRIAFDGPYADFEAVVEGPAREYLRAMPALHERPTPE